MPGPSAVAPPSRPSFDLQVAADGDVILLSLHGHLDADAGRMLLEAARAAADHDAASRLDVDIRRVTSFTHDGAAALAACRDVGAQLAQGLHYRTGQGPGREALLAAYQRA
jgi:hypothetical protein